MKKKRKIVFVVILVLIIMGGAFGYIYLNKNKKKNTTIKNDNKEYYSAYKMSSNGLEEFDLSFLKLENNKKNMLYSPLSIKYALSMLSSGASGSSKKEIDAVIGDYKSKKYINSENMSFANAMFIKDKFKDQVKKSYTDKLSKNYDASVIYDSFETPDNLNEWVSDKTFGLINNMFDKKVAYHNFYLVNALAIDMEWNKWLQATWENYKEMYHVTYNHEKYSDYIDLIEEDNYPSLEFNNNSMIAKSVKIGASINNYDIIKDLGEDNIRKLITSEYQEFIDNDGCGIRTSGDTNSDDLDVDKYVDKFIGELKENYHRVDTSTDFMLYTDDKVKAFAKDLKTYNGTTLQYVGIMPLQEELDSYIKDLDSSDINSIIKNLKEIKSESFNDGKVIKITGNIPLFKFDYQLKLMDDLKKIGITSVFNQNKADLSNMVTSKNYIDSAEHKANIEFSNEGIKAAAVTSTGGMGAASCGYEHLFDVPVEEVNITFDKPYLFLIRDKNSGEVWFVGSVYEPTKNN